MFSDVHSCFVFYNNISCVDVGPRNLSVHYFLISKGLNNIFTLFFLRWSGIRDDLLFLLDEDLCNVSLCSLHSEMRNTEQLLGSLGLFSYRCGALEECNEAISNYGPEISRGYDN